jgi:hypothetical protein
MERTAALGCLLPYVAIAKTAAKSIKQPFQFAYLMDIPRCIERLVIARSGHRRQ